MTVMHEQEKEGTVSAAQQVRLFLSNISIKSSIRDCKTVVVAAAAAASWDCGVVPRVLVDEAGYTLDLAKFSGGVSKGIVKDNIVVDLDFNHDPSIFIEQSGGDDVDSWTLKKSFKDDDESTASTISVASMSEGRVFTCHSSLYLDLSSTTLSNHSSDVAAAIEDLRQGRFVMLSDDAGRENEVDLILDAAAVTPEKITFLVNQSTGIVCVPLDAKSTAALNLPDMVAASDDRHGTKFTVSVDHVGTSTGVSSIDRSTTIKALVDWNCGPADFFRPGHIFPLRSDAGGLAARQGHTEASLALVKACRSDKIHRHGAVISELICKKDGKMLRPEDATGFSRRYGIRFIEMKDVIAYLTK